MKIPALAEATVPVIIGVFVAGLIMYAMRDVDIVNRAHKGFDG